MTTNSARSAIPAVLAGLLVCGCATGQHQDQLASNLGGQYVTTKEIRASGATTAWDALRYTVKTHRFSDYRGVPVRIHSDRGQGSMVLREDPMVFLDGVRLTDILLLRMIPADNLYSIQVITGPDATTYYGTSAVAGVILLETTLGGEIEGDTVVAPDTVASRS